MTEAHEPSVQEHEHRHADYQHDHADHDHGFKGHAHGANESRIAVAAVLTGVFMLAEVVGGLVSGSLALLADAGHMLTDFAALALGWFAFRLARRPGDAQRTYGYDRFEVLVAFVNGLALFAIAAFILVEAIQLFTNPGEVMGGLMMAVAVAGLLVNIAVFFVLHSSDRENLNIRGAVLHVMGDLLGSVAAIVAALVILWTGWTPIDPLLSVLVSIIILVSAWRLVRDAGHVLLEGTPKNVAIAELEPALCGTVAGLKGVHHVHVWSITPERSMATLHAAIDDDADGLVVTRRIKQVLRERFSIGHATVEIERGACADSKLEPDRPGGGPARAGSARTEEADHAPDSAPHVA